MMRRRHALAAALLSAAALLPAACGGDDSESSSAPAAEKPTGTPIVLGSVNALSGPVTFPEASAAAKAVFDRVNDQGGINDHPIEFAIEDDGSNAAKGASAAKKLISEKKVVGMVGGASLLECAINSKLYASSKIYSIMGTGVDPVCFASPNIAPVNTGPYVGAANSLYYLSNTAKKAPICWINQNVPALKPGYDAALASWEKASGQKLKAFLPIEPSADPGPVLAKIRSAGCKGVLIVHTEPGYIAIMQGAAAQGLLNKDIQWVFATSGYSDKIGEAVAQANGTKASSEFLPYTSDSAELKDFKDLMKSKDIDPGSFAEGGYLAATAAVEALKTVKGEYTTASVGEAFKALNYKTPLLAEPLTFAPGPNKSTQMVTLESGKWDGGDGKWIKLPGAGE